MLQSFVDAIPRYYALLLMGPSACASLADGMSMHVSYNHMHKRLSHVVRGTSTCMELVDY